MTTATGMMATEPGTPERKVEYLAYRLRASADEADRLAADVATWSTDEPTRGLGLIERAQRLVADGEAFVRDDLIGDHTTASLLNEGSIALGITNSYSARGRGDLGYALLYAYHSRQQYPDAAPLAAASLGGITTRASSIRVYAATLRVVAGLLDKVLAGEIRRVR